MRLQFELFVLLISHLLGTHHERRCRSARNLRSFQSLNLFLDRIELYKIADHVDDRLDEPDEVRDEFKLVEELLVHFVKSNLMEEKRMIAQVINS